MAKKIKELPEGKSELESLEVIPAKTVETKSVEGFEGKNLHMIADGLFRYQCEEVSHLPRDFFSQAAAKNYGLRKGDLVLIYDNDSVKTVVVRG